MTGLFVCFRNMKGMEYVLLHVMEPVLYVIRKNYRQGPDKCEPLMGSQCILYCA